MEVMYVNVYWESLDEQCRYIFKMRCVRPDETTMAVLTLWMLRSQELLILVSWMPQQSQSGPEGLESP